MKVSRFAHSFDLYFIGSAVYFVNKNKISSYMLTSFGIWVKIRCAKAHLEVKYHVHTMAYTGLSSCNGRLHKFGNSPNYTISWTFTMIFTPVVATIEFFMFDNNRKGYLLLNLGPQLSHHSYNVLILHPFCSNMQMASDP